MDYGACGDKNEYIALYQEANIVAAAQVQLARMGYQIPEPPKSGGGTKIVLQPFFVCKFVTLVLLFKY